MVEHSLCNAPLRSCQHQPHSSLFAQKEEDKEKKKKKKKKKKKRHNVGEGMEEISELCIVVWVVRVVDEVAYLKKEGSQEDAGFLVWCQVI